MNFLNKMERKFGRYAIHNLSAYIIALYVAGYLLYFFAPALSAGSWIRSSRTYCTTIGCHRFYL